MRAVCAGHICLDVTPVFPADGSLSSLRPGGLVNVGPAAVNTGGSVANTGLALRYFGVETALMGKVGRDAFGELVRIALDERGGSDGMIVDPGCDTSYSVVIAPPGTDRIFLHDPGANESFTAADIDDEALKGAAWFHFGYPPLMRSMYADNGAELERVFKKAKAHGCVTSLDMAAIQPDTPAGRSDWRSILARVLPYVDFFLPSWEELAYMTDRELWEAHLASGSDALSLARDIEPLADATMALDCNNLIIKCGAAGFYYRTSGDLAGIGAALSRDMSGWAEQSGFEASYTPARVASATGAGDTTIAAFIAATLSGCGFEECLHLAAATGASCVEGVDALSALRPLGEQAERIRAGWPKQRLLAEDI